MEHRRLITGLRIGWYLGYCAALSIGYFGSGFIYGFMWSLKPSNSAISDGLSTILNILCYSLGTLSCGYFIQYGRRRALLISDIVCIILIPFLLISHHTIDLVCCFVTSFFEGWWAVAVFVYGKDISIVHHPGFIAVFAQIMNAIGVLLANILQYTEQYWKTDYQGKLLYKRICVCFGLVIPCIIQLSIFLTVLKKEPIRYEFEKSGEEEVYDSLQQLISDNKSVQRIVGALRRSSAYKKFVGVQYLTMLSPFYRKAFLIILALFSFKGFTYLLSYFNRLAHEVHTSLFSEYLLYNSGVKVLFLSCGLFLTVRLQKKTQLLIGYILCGILNLLTLYASIQYNNNATRFNALFYMYSMAMADYIYMGLISYVPYVLALELLPDKGVAIVITFYMIFSSIMQSLTKGIGDQNYMKPIYYAFMTFVCIGALIFVKICMKYTETNTEEGTKKAYLEGSDDLKENLASSVEGSVSENSEN